MVQLSMNGQAATYHDDTRYACVAYGGFVCLVMSKRRLYQVYIIRIC